MPGVTPIAAVRSAVDSRSIVGMHDFLEAGDSTKQHRYRWRGWCVHGEVSVTIDASATDVVSATPHCMRFIDTWAAAMLCRWDPSPLADFSLITPAIDFTLQSLSSGSQNGRRRRSKLQTQLKHPIWFNLTRRACEDDDGWRDSKNSDRGCDAWAGFDCTEQFRGWDPPKVVMKKCKKTCDLCDATNITKTEPNGYRPVCMYVIKESLKWSRNGCTTTVVGAVIRCHCIHLTSSGKDLFGNDFVRQYISVARVKYIPEETASTTLLTALYVGAPVLFIMILMFAGRQWIKYR